MKRVLFSFCCLFLATCWLIARDDKPTKRDVPPATSRPIDFQQDIQPILTQKCLTCHGAEKQRGGLRLDSRKDALLGGNSGVVLQPGNALKSKLFQAIAGLDAELQMPPKGKPGVTPTELAHLRAWIDQGLKWPESGVVGKRTSNHWSFQAIKRPAIPEVKNRGWIKNDIDAFILARLEQEGLSPSPEADRVTLIRRLSLDLLGLPPTPKQVEEFLRDPRPDAYEQLVGRLLSSPHYGERWGRHWLDAARYADSDGFEKDTGRPFAWRWRDWVIDALNRDLPYDRFVIEQLAGDLLPGATIEQKVATGFHRNTLTNKEGGVDQEQFRVEQVVDRVNTTAKVFLGITLACAQCHDHKYDPLTQREYYQFFAFFNSDKEVNIPAPLPEAKDKDKPPQAQTLAMGPRRKTNVMIRGDFLRPGAEVQPGVPEILPSLTKREGEPTRLDLAQWIVNPANPLTARVFVNWMWHKYFGRGIVPILDDFGTQGEKPSHPELLDYLATEFMSPSPQPLSPEGRGAANPSPLGGEGRVRGWSMKAMHRLIVTSATYRQSSEARPEVARRDPINVLLARQNRLRLEAEVLRDAALASSGLLERTIGGPSVRPPQPGDISKLTYANSAKWVESTGRDRYRRGLYTWFQRTSPYPMLLTFDAPDSNVCCVRREKSNTPLQALTLLNDVVFVECAQALGRRIVEEAKPVVQERIRHGFQLCLAREPSTQELERLTRFHGELLALCQAKPDEAAKLVGKYKPAGVSAPEAAAWVALARTLMNLDEFITRE